MEDWTWVVLGLVGLLAAGGLVVGVFLLIRGVSRGTGNSYVEPSPSGERNPRNPRREDGASGRPTWLNPTGWSGQQLVEDQIKHLKGTGFHPSDLRVLDGDENTFYIAVPCDKVTVHFIYDTARPHSPPTVLISEKAKLNSFGEITEQQLNLDLGTVSNWKSGSLLLDVMNEVQRKLRRGYDLNEHGEVVWRYQ